MKVEEVVGWKLEEDKKKKKYGVDQVKGEEMIIEEGEIQKEIIDQEIDDEEKLVWKGKIGDLELRKFEKEKVKVERNVEKRKKEGKIVQVGGGGDKVEEIKNEGVEEELKYI